MKLETDIANPDDDTPREGVPPELIDKPHDALFRALLSHPRRSWALLRAHLRSWTIEMLADESPVPLDPSFVGEDLRRSQGDKLLQVTLKNGEPGYVHVLLEHKSFPDAGVALQVWKYKVRIWEQYAQNQESKLGALPTIIPVVFYHGSKEWTAPGSVREMLGTKDRRLRELEPGFGYYFRDLREMPVEQLASDAETRAGLIALRHSHDKGQEERLRALPEVLAGPRSGSEYEKQVILYLMGVWRMSVGKLKETAEEVKPRRGRAVVGQIVQELIDSGFVRGEASGLVRGEASGLVRGEAGTLTEFLESRFGTLPRAVRAWIAGAPADELSSRFTYSLEAESLAEVFPEFDLD